MDYDYRNRSGSTYDSPMYRTSSTSSAPSNHPMYGGGGGGGGSSLYPRVGQPGPNMIPPPTRTSSHSQHHHSSPSSGLGIRVAIKPQYRITPPPQLSTQIGDIPRSSLQFDFEFERKILAEAEKDSQNWSRFGPENLPSRNTESTSSMQRPVGDPVVNKFITMGLNREAVPLAVANYGDNPTKVQEFVKGYGLLREMGFSSSNVAEALVMFDNDTDKAIAHFLNSST